MTELNTNSPATQKLRFYQKGTFTVGNRLVSERERSVQASIDRSNALTCGHRACQGCGEALFEAEHGVVTASRKIRRMVPVTEYLQPQKRFAHLFSSEPGTQQVAKLQALAARNIVEFHLLEREGDA